MGCVATKFEEEEEVVSICRERKHQLKLAVERRYILADAHYKYCQALYGVSAAIKLFVARHSSATPPYLITFPPASPSSPPKEKVVSNPLFLQQSVCESAQETIVCGPCKASTSSESSEEEQEESVEKAESHVCGYFYMDMPQMMPSPQRDFGWDFFNPFTAMRPEMMNGYNKISEEDLRAVREQEGIPELEEEEEEGGVRMMEEQRKMMVAEEKEKAEEAAEEKGVEVAKSVDGGDVSREEEKGLAVVDTPLEGRELLEALQDIEDHFIRAYDSGKEVSRMLEANWAYSQSNLEELKGENVSLLKLAGDFSNKVCAF